MGAATTETLIGQGLYSVQEAARYLQVPTATLRRWITGYRFIGRDGRSAFSPGLLVGDPLLVDGEPVLTFADMIELQFVHLFREQGVSMPVIRAAAARAALLFENDRPFTVRRLQTDGVRIFAELDRAEVERAAQQAGEKPESAGRLTQELATGQMVVSEMARVYYRNLDYHHDTASRWWPMGREQRVVLDPARSFGKPIDHASGVPLRPLYEMVRAGETISAVAEWYEVDEEAVLRAIEFELRFLRAGK